MQKQLAMKLLTILVVGGLTLIPTTLVKYKIEEREARLVQARQDVAQGWTGPQLLTTPVLVLPYELSAVSESGFYNESDLGQSSGLAVVLPDQVHSDIEVANETVFKGIYEVAIFKSEAVLTGVFTVETLQEQLDKIRRLPRFERFGQPYLSMHIADMRGIDEVPTLTVNNAPVMLNSGSGLSPLADGLHAEIESLPGPAEELRFTLNLSLRGMGCFSFVNLADTATTEIRSDWPHPAFVGAMLPVERQISSSGFKASWTSTRYSSNAAGLLEGCITSGDCRRLLATSAGVNFIEPVDVYLQSERSVKYAVLFIGLSFVTFIIFEQLKKIRIHPIQYAFVGLVIAIFYLLLISLAEHIAFYLAYSVAVMCCSALLLFYVRYLLGSFYAALLFSLMIVALYGALYVIVQAEDFALLMGAFLVFVVLAALMFVTRRVDWYALAESGVTNG